MRRKYLVADVSLGIGVVAGAAATFLFLTARHAASPTARSWTPLVAVESRGFALGAARSF